MSKRRALGRGLEAIIPQGTGDQAPGTALEEIAVTQISPNRAQPRREFGQEQLEELAASLREHGMLEPVIVRKQGSAFELVVGERRWRAAQLAGLQRIPAIVKEMGDREAAELALVENLQREDLNPLDEAEAFQRLSMEFGMTQEEIAARVGKQRSTVANRMRLLELEAALQEDVRKGHLSAGHGRALLAVTDSEERLRLAKRIMSEGLSVRQVEEVTRRPKGAKRIQKQQRAVGGRQQALDELAEGLQQALGTRVQIMKKGRRGQIQIEFYGDDDVTRIYELIVGNQ